MEWVLVSILSYLFGSVPFSYIIPKWWKGVDVRKMGSGNVGATNVIRNVGTGVGALCLFLDAMKGFLPVFITRSLFGEPKLVALAAITAVLGHDFPVFLKFKGGKGVSSSFGVVIALSWLLGLIFAAVWTVLVFVTKYASVGSLTALYLSAVLGFLILGYDAGMLVLILAVLSTLRHSENIQRLARGEEKKVELFKRWRK